MNKSESYISHDKWFRDQVALAVAEADSPNAVWHEHDAMFDALELATL